MCLLFKKNNFYDNNVTVTLINKLIATNFINSLNNIFFKHLTFLIDLDI